MISKKRVRKELFEKKKENKKKEIYERNKISKIIDFVKWILTNKTDESKEKTKTKNIQI